MSPAQIVFVLEQHTEKKKRRGTAADLVAMAGGSRR